MSTSEIQKLRTKLDRAERMAVKRQRAHARLQAHARCLRQERDALRRQLERTQERGVALGMVDPYDAVLPWQDRRETEARLEAMMGGSA